ncbi:MAG: NAD(P)-dependent dehydrogenase (short-subunit alcohol dehydrogenase family) [Hyphomicrobiaceae bacterium]|jgi:NAD(P)-dependent dehydrogenase (short-subunit alcohol dehydrogenase family)
MLGGWLARLLPGSRELRDRAVAIIGAAEEPGIAITLAAAAEGARLALIETSPGQHNQLLEQAKHAGGTGIAAASLAEAAETLRGLDIVIFTTGDPAPVSLRTLEAERFEALLREQAVAALAYVQEAVAVMEERGHGTIVAVVGGPGWSRSAGLGAHAAAQAATLRTLDALREEIAEVGIHLATVVPSGLAGWQPSAAQIADGVTTVIRLQLRALTLPPGAQAIEAMASLAPEPIGNLIAWFAGPPPPLIPEPRNRPSVRAEETETDVNGKVTANAAEPQSNNNAVRAAAARAADLMDGLSRKRQP